MQSDSDIVDDIIKDHREVEEIYKRYKASPNTEEGRKWFNQFMWELCRHSVAEELVMYNMMESINDKGKELGEKSRQDHRKLKVMLEDLRKETNETAFEKKFDDLFTTLMSHIKMEESEDLPFIKQNVSLEKRQAAAKTFSMKKMLAPTYPHPEVPDKPTALEAALGLLAKPIDKIRDMFKEFPSKAEMEPLSK